MHPKKIDESNFFPAFTHSNDPLGEELFLCLSEKVLPYITNDLLVLASSPQEKIKEAYLSALGAQEGWLKNVKKPLSGELRDNYGGVFLKKDLAIVFSLPHNTQMRKAIIDKMSYRAKFIFKDEEELVIDEKRFKEDLNKVFASQKRERSLLKAIQKKCDRAYNHHDDYLIDGDYLAEVEKMIESGRHDYMSSLLRIAFDNYFYSGTNEKEHPHYRSGRADLRRKIGVKNGNRYTLKNTSEEEREGLKEKTHQYIAINYISPSVILTKKETSNYLKWCERSLSQESSLNNMFSLILPWKDIDLRDSTVEKIVTLIKKGEIPLKPVIARDNLLKHDRIAKELFKIGRENQHYDRLSLLDAEKWWKQAGSRNFKHEWQSYEHRLSSFLIYPENKKRFFFLFSEKKK